MKKTHAFLLTSLAVLTLTGIGLSSNVAEAKESKPIITQEEPAAKAPQRKLKPWEEKYYELHPEAKKQDEEKGNPSKHHSSDDDEDWHRI